MKVAWFAYLLMLISILSCKVEQEQWEKEELTVFVNNFIGSSGGGRVIPAAAVPFGMVQLGPDTRTKGSGYEYSDNTILGFSHIHKSGGGCNDFLDVLFQPFNGHGYLHSGPPEEPDKGYRSRFSHQNETSAPGYYEVLLHDDSISVALTVTPRCGFQQYTFSSPDSAGILIDLKHGSRYACTIVREENRDTVVNSGIYRINDHTLAGFRISSGWAREQHVYFAAEFSAPFQSVLYRDDQESEMDSLMGNNIKGKLWFNLEDNRTVLVKVGISPVSVEGALKNLTEEIPHWDFNAIRKAAKQSWQASLEGIQLETTVPGQKELFYSALYNVLLYPMLYSDVDGRFRGADHQVHNTDGGRFYGGASGLWDVFRAAHPLITVLHPEIANDNIHTFLSHYKITGQLPVFLLAGNETLTMIGNHSMPIISDAYFKGIRDYDEELLFEAMKETAQKDSFGISMGRVMGNRNYRRYGYIPADLEYESVAITLELAYDDWCIAQMARMLGHEQDYNYYKQQSANYRNVFDAGSGFMRGRMFDGSWRTPFDPLHSNHRKDDYCEGNAWQWTFFVPHDIPGLMELMGGKDSLERKLDRLFSLNADLSGGNTSGDITGLIGQYAHGNEPSHHVAYMYNFTGKPWKTQKMVRQILASKYDNTPTGMCGNEDTGQMSAWYIWSSLGFYPVTHGDGRYMIGSPAIEKARVRHVLKGKENRLSIYVHDQGEANVYIQKVSLNGRPHNKPWFDHYDLFSGENRIDFYMGEVPNQEWGVMDYSVYN